MSTETQERTELVWVVAPAEERPRRKIEIELAAELSAKLAKMKEELADPELKERVSGALSQAIAGCMGVPAAAWRLATGTMRASIAAREYEARTGRPYPVCAPHRAIVTARYESLRVPTAEAMQAAVDEARGRRPTANRQLLRLNTMIAALDSARTDVL